VKSDLINDYEINDKNSRRAKREELWKKIINLLIIIETHSNQEYITNIVFELEYHIVQSKILWGLVKLLVMIIKL
jgi:polyribonucleotide nucleotidyltransferase